MRKFDGRRLMIGFAGREPDEEFADVLRRTGAMGVILFARNASTADHASELIARIRALVDRPLVIATDQEGGSVVRLVDGVVLFPGNACLGATGDVALARAQGEAVGRRLASIGFDFNLAPVVDRQGELDNPIVGSRSFGADPDLVVHMAEALVAGHAAGGIASCLKHFPGLGAATVDPHHDLPRLDGGPASASHPDVDVFARVLAARPRAAVMTTHVIAPGLDADLPATFSRRIVTDLLRGDLDFDGVVVADDLEMGAIIKHHDIGDAVVACAAAGHDFIPVCHDAGRQLRAAEALTRAVADGTLDRDEHERSVSRIAGLCIERPGVPAADDPALDLACEIARRGARVLSDPHGVLPLGGRRAAIVVFEPPTDPGHETTWGGRGAEGPAETLRRLRTRAAVGAEDLAAVTLAADRDGVLVDLVPDMSDREALVLAVWRVRRNPGQRALVEEAARRWPGRIVVWGLDGVADDVLDGREAAVTAHGWKTPNLVAAARIIVGS